MKLMVVGGGGREHALIKALRKNPEVTEIYALPGNGGIAADAVCVAIAAGDIDMITAFAVQSQVDFAVVAPDDPLVLGAVDALEAAGIPCFGPTKSAAAIEGSKAFAKDLMGKYGIPTAKYRVFDDMSAAMDYIDRSPMPVVVKADGLALGKGVIIAPDADAARTAVRQMMEDKKFGESGSRVVIEEFLEGPEVSVLAFTDGETVAPMASSMDHKRALDGDQGLNTGGMGAVAPNPFYTDAVARECMERIFLPTVRAMNAQGRTFRGCLYFGLMLTQAGPKVIEYNCRFGDPEAQAVLPLLKSDLLTVMRACREGRLAETAVEFSQEASCCLVMASAGYPQRYDTGYVITLDEDFDAELYVAGARLDGGRLLSAGGRVLGVTATAESLKAAVDRAYAQAEKVHFENAFIRHDIGARALAALEK